MSVSKRAEIELAVTGVQEVEAKLQRARAALLFSDKSVANLNSSLQKGATSAQNFSRVVDALGATGLPGLGRGAQVATQGLGGLLGSMEALYGVRKSIIAAGLPFAGIVGGAAAAGLAIGAVASAWSDYAEAQRQATESSQAWEKQRDVAYKGLLRDLDILEKMDLIGQNQRNFVLLGPNADDPARRKTASVDPGAAIKRLNLLKQSLGVISGMSQVDLFRLKISESLATGEEKERARVEAIYAQRKQELVALLRKEDVSKETVQQLQSEVELEHEALLARVDEKKYLEAKKLASEYQLRLQNEQAQAVKDEAAAMDSIVAKAKAIYAEQQKVKAEQEAKRTREGGLYRDLSIARLDIAANDPNSPDGGKAAVLQQESIMHQERLAQIGDNNALIEQAEALHQERILAIERAYAAKRLAVQQNVLTGTSDMLGAAAQIAKLYGREGFAAYKAFAIGQAVINTALAISNELSQGDIYSKAFRVAGVAALGAAQIASIAAQDAGYRIGGYTGNGAPYRVAGPVHRGEYVFSAPAVQRIGVGNLDSLHSSAVAGASGSGTEKPMQIILADNRRRVQDLKNDPNFRNIVVDIMADSQWRFK